MAATHPRRKKGESRAESATYDLTIFLEQLVNAELPLKAVILKVLGKSGPFTIHELRAELRNVGKITNSDSAVRKAVYELKKNGMVVKVNGGYAIYNWMEIGA